VVESYTTTAPIWVPPTHPTTSFTINLRELALLNRIAMLEQKVAELEARIKKLEEEKRK
jgi:uncharacterized protein YceH (UPF0502 family)